MNGRLLPCGRLILAVLVSVWLAGFALGDESDKSDAGVVRADDAANGWPVRETVIVGLRLTEARKSDRIHVDDLDILWVPGEQRLLPLFRICRELEIKCSEGVDLAVLRNLAGDTVTVDPTLAQVRMVGAVMASPFQLGRSDVTGLPEIWLPDTVIARCLAIPLEWNESSYAYIGTTKFSIPKLERLRAEKPKSANRSTKELKNQGTALPELLPPATARHFHDPSLAIIRPGVRVSAMTPSNFVFYRTLDLWGRLIGGEYSFSLRQSDPEWRSFTRLDEAYWHARRGNFEINAGDVSFGLHDLVLPAASMEGVEMSGILGAARESDSSPRSSSRGQLDFGTRQDFHGFARLGSTVRLYRDDYFVAEQQVVETKEAPLGEGAYHFRGVNLTQGTRNEIRIVVVEPDSTVREQTRQILGTNRLLGAGQVAFIGGVGTRRLPDEDFWYTQGRVLSGRLSVGVLPSMTVSSFAAYQRDYAFAFPLRALSDSRQSGRMRVPRESTHAGGEWAWRVYDRSLLAISGAASKADGDSVVRYAGRASLTATAGPVQFQPQVFIYQPAYFNGINNWLENRQGYAASLIWDPTRWPSVTIAAGQVQDNVDRSRNSTTTLDWQRGMLQLSRFLKGAELRLSGSRLIPKGSDAFYVWSAEGRAELPVDFRLSGVATWGDDYYQIEGRTLLDDLGLADAPRYSRNGWEANLSRKIFRGGYMAAIHSNQPYRQRTYLDHSYRSPSTGSLQWRVQGGYDWRLMSSFGEAQVSYQIDRSGTGSIGLTARYQDKSWVYGLTLSLMPTFALNGVMPYLVTRSQLDPRIGGLAGRVFMDRNGNGIREAGEPGVSGVEVLTDSGQRIKTTKEGSFVVPPGGGKQNVHLQLNPQTIPATCNAVSGAQWAEIEEGAFTEVNLSLAVLNSISGSVLGPNPNDTVATIGIHGVKVLARTPEGKIVRESVTAGDGTYYLGELKPGPYELDVDPQTLPRGYQIAARPQRLTLETTDVPVDLHGVSFECSFVAPPTREDQSPGTAPQKPDIEYKKF